MTLGSNFVESTLIIGPGNPVQDAQAAVISESPELAGLSTVDDMLLRLVVLHGGIPLGSVLWEKLKAGELAGNGKPKDEWQAFLLSLEGNRSALLDCLKPEISRELGNFSFAISGSGGGGFFSVGPLSDSVIVWDDVSDLDRLHGEVILGDSDVGDFSGTITHEYFHGIFAVYGEYASKESRMINREQFDSDIARLVVDPDYQNSEVVRLEKGWVVDASSVSGGVITAPHSLTECFATLSEIYYKDKSKLPDYIQRHFEVFFKDQQTAGS